MSLLISEHFIKNFPLPHGWKIKKQAKQSFCLFTNKNLAFCPKFENKKKLSHKQPLAKAIGFNSKALSILDVTGGWLKEAFLLAQAGYQVTAIESHPFVFHFTMLSLKKNKKHLKNLIFKLDNSFNYLKNIKEYEKPDVIYMDPMFGNRKKSLSQKPLLILKEIAGETKNKKELFKLCLRIAKKRVVVKRHHLELPLQKKPLCVFRGHSTCYDIFNPKR